MDRLILNEYVSFSDFFIGKDFCTPGRPSYNSRASSNDGYG